MESDEKVKAYETFFKRFLFSDNFKKYLKEYFAIDNIPFDFHVDHMQSKVFFKNKYPEYFIRLFLLDKKINCYYGCKYKKLQASYEKTGSQMVVII